MEARPPADGGSSGWHRTPGTDLAAGPHGPVEGEECHNGDHDHGDPEQDPELGHRSIACVNYGPPRVLSVAARCEGYRQELVEAGIRYDESLVAWADFSHESGFAAASELLDTRAPPTAIFAGNDTVAPSASDWSDSCRAGFASAGNNRPFHGALI